MCSCCHGGPNHSDCAQCELDRQTQVNHNED